MIYFKLLHIIKNDATTE